MVRHVRTCVSRGINFIQQLCVFMFCSEAMQHIELKMTLFRGCEIIGLVIYIALFREPFAGNLPHTFEKYPTSIGIRIQHCDCLEHTGKQARHPSFLTASSLCLANDDISLVLRLLLSCVLVQLIETQFAEPFAGDRSSAQSE